MRSHEVDYKIFGDDLQFVEIELDPGESVIAEAGTMMYLEDDITFETKMGDGSDPDQGAWGKLKSASRILSRDNVEPALIGRSATATRVVAARSWRARKLRTKASTTTKPMRTWDTDSRRLTGRRAGCEVPASLRTFEGA